MIKLVGGLGIGSLLILSVIIWKLARSRPSRKYGIDSAFGKDEPPDTQIEDTQKTINQMTCRVLSKLEKSRVFSFLTNDELRDISFILEQLRSLVSSEHSDLGSFETAVEEDASFCSAQTLPIQCEDDLCYTALILHQRNPQSIRCARLWTATVGLDSDAVYLARLYCVRKCFEQLAEDVDFCGQLYSAGRAVITRLNVQAEGDYDELVDYARSTTPSTLRREMELLGMVEFGLYDLVFDYLLLSFLHLANDPPALLLQVVNSRFLLSYVKEMALSTTIVSFIGLRRRLLSDREDSTQFRRQLYSFAEKVLPSLAWGLFSPESALHSYSTRLRDALSLMFADMYCTDSAFATQDTLSAHIRAVVGSTVTILSDDDSIIKK